MTQPPDAYRQLLARLEADRDRMLAAASKATVDEVRIAQSALASGYLHAAVCAVRLFEGADAAQAYLQQHADGEHHTVHDDEPAARELAAEDRAYWTTRYDH